MELDDLQTPNNQDSVLISINRSNRIIIIDPVRTLKIIDFGKIL